MVTDNTDLENGRRKRTRSSIAAEVTTSPAQTTPNRHHRRDWPCPHCLRAFKKREHLERHVRSHTKEKPFTCSTCSKSYGRRDSLMRHERGHSERPRKNAGHQPGPDGSIPENKVFAIGDTSSPNQDTRVDPFQYTQQHDSLRTTRSTTTNNSRVRSENPEHSAIPFLASGTPPAMAFTSYLTAGSVDTPDLQLGWDPSENIETMSIEPDYCEPFWFIGDSFCLDDLNSSLSAAASPRVAAAPNLPSNSIRTRNSVQPAVPYDAPITSRSPLRTVQSCWHTRPNANDAPILLLANLRKQDHVDDAYRTGLSSRLTIHPHDDTLPSAEFLNLCIKLYFAKFQPIFPVIHAGSFRPSSETALVVLSICSIGSLFVGSSSAIARGRAIFAKLNKAILASWEGYLHRGGHETLAVSQAATLGQTYGMLSGHPRDLVMTESFHGTIIAWARQAGMFSQDSDTPPRLNPTPDQLDAAWRQWAEKQEKIRIVLALHVHDSEFAAIFHHEPLLRHDLKRALLSCSDELFTATSAKQWYLLQQANPNHLFATEASQAAAGLSFSMHEYAFLAAQIATLHEDPSSHRDPAAVSATRQRLIAWTDSFPAASFKPHRDTLCLKILWHEAFMILYADFDLLERVVGRDGPSPSDKDIDRLYRWVNSADGIRCLIHATLVVNRLQGLTLGAEPAIHVPKALFYAGLVAYCHLKYRARGESLSNVEVIELKNREARDSSQRDLTSAPQLDAGVIYGIADLLRRQGHWELSRQFSNMFELLIDDLSVATPHS